MIRKVFPLCLVAIAIIATNAHAEKLPSDIPVAKTTIKTLAAFKNGLGFVFRSGEASLKDGYAEIEEVPAAAHGTYWVSSTDPRSPIEELVSYKKKSSKSVQAISIPEILAANVGKKLAVTVQRGNEEARIEGKLVSVPVERKSDPTPAPRYYDSVSPFQPNAQAQIIVMEVVKDGAKTTQVLNRNSITSVEIPGDAVENGQMQTEVGASRIKLRGKPSKAGITVAYLQKGFNWSPGYLVDLLSDKEAQITMDAVLSNDNEDLEDADISFVVGFPNFAYADAITPLALNQTVGSFIQSLVGAESRRGSGMRDSVMAQSAMYNVASYDVDNSRSWRASDAYSANVNLAGESNEDLYFYKQDHVNLKKGERARYTVLTAKVPCEHIYTWDIPDSSQINESGYRSGNQNERIDTPQIWHTLRLENTSGKPWTTAPAIAVKGSTPVSQDILRYAAAKSKTNLKLTVATDIKGDQMQTEESRKEVNVLYTRYFEVTVSGKLTVTNYKDKPVKMSVVKTITGDVITCNDGKTRKVAKKLNAVNQISDITWEFELPAGASKELTYTYKVFATG